MTQTHLGKAIAQLSVLIQSGSLDLVALVEGRAWMRSAPIRIRRSSRGCWRRGRRRGDCLVETAAGGAFARAVGWYSRRLEGSVCYRRPADDSRIDRSRECCSRTRGCGCRQGSESGGYDRRRPGQYERVCLFRPRPQSALRHAAQSAGLGYGPDTGRLIFGSAVAVASGLVPVSIGTDTGGSVRIPSAFNGLVGYKASRGRYSMAGVFPLATSLDSLGPLCRSVQDAVWVDAAMRGRAAPDVIPCGPRRALDRCADAIS